MNAKSLLLGMVSAMSLSALAANELTVGDCRASWTDGELVLQNSHFRRVLRAVNGSLRTVSYRRGDYEWISSSQAVMRVAGPLPTFRAEPARWSPVSEPGLKVTADFGAVTNAYLLVPSVAGVLVDRTQQLRPEALAPELRLKDRGAWWTTMREGASAVKGSDQLALSARNVLVTEIDLYDRTDGTNELLSEREWLLMMREHPKQLDANILVVEDTFTGEGLAWVRLAPLPDIRPVRLPDFSIVGSEYGPNRVQAVTGIDNGWPIFEFAYSGGKIGRIAAMHAFQRSLRMYRPGRDGVFLSNNWGGGYSDRHLNEEFLQREIAAGARLGVEVIQVDDGWQKGRSQNSSDVKNKKGNVWGDFRHADPEFWRPCPIRLPHGLDPLVAAARAKGMRFGLWYGPDSAEDARYWREDAKCLLDFYRQPGIQYFKIDSLKSMTTAAMSNQRQLFDSLLEASNGEITFDLDVTAGRRPGYFGLPHIGPIFVENRYTQHGGYWPHFTLRSLWTLSGVMDPVRMRIELLDPDQYPEKYSQDDFLRPELYRADTVFAVAMCASPLGWMELSRLSERRIAEMQPLVARWKREREALHSGTTWPIGAKPDGRAWTGFVTLARDGDGYLLLFRERNEHSGFAFDVAPYLKSLSGVELIGGRGKIRAAGTVVSVQDLAPLDFVWIKLRH